MVFAYEVKNNSVKTRRVNETHHDAERNEQNLSEKRQENSMWVTYEK